LAVPIAIVVGYSEYIPAILGANWVGLSLIIPVYGVMLFVNSVSNTSSYFVVYRKYKAEGYFNILLTSLPLIVILYGSRFLNGMESVYLYCFVGILLYFLLNMYWAVVTKNTACFLGNYMLSTGLNLVAVLVILSLNEVSLPLSLGVMSLYLLLYTRYLLWERFNALKNV
jgi:hypothetical protein